MKLPEYLKRSRIKQVIFARMIGITPAALSNILSGKRGASADLIGKIFQCTGGAVDFSDWHPISNSFKIK